jgi:hypothetical protein
MVFFFEKKKQKTFMSLRTLVASPRQHSKSFLVPAGRAPPFFKKEHPFTQV